MLKIIIENHHRSQNFFTKIEQILQFLKIDISQTFSNKELFDMFLQNKRILLYFIENEIIKIDKSIYDILRNPSNINYFFPEIESYILQHPIKYENENQIRFEKYEKLRKQGENDNIIAEMIRNDEVVDFITYVNKNNYSLNNKISKISF